MKVLGISDEITVCDLCGKRNLKCTVALEHEDGQVVHYGRDCAGLAVFGRKSRGNTERAEIQARARCRVDPVVHAIRNTLPHGIEAAVAAGRAATDQDRVWWSDYVPGEACDIRGHGRAGMHVTIAGYRSWGKIVVHYCGGQVEIPV